MTCTVSIISLDEVTLTCMVKQSSVNERTMTCTVKHYSLKETAMTYTVTIIHSMKRTTMTCTVKQRSTNEANLICKINHSAIFEATMTLRSSSDTRMLEIQQYKRKTHGFRTFSCFGPHLEFTPTRPQTLLNPSCYLLKPN